MFEATVSSPFTLIASSVTRSLPPGDVCRQYAFHARRSNHPYDVSGCYGCVAFAVSAALRMLRSRAPSSLQPRHPARSAAERRARPPA